MEYEVVITQRAEQQLNNAAKWYADNATAIAADWYNGFLNALLSLESNPEQHGITHESEEFPVPIRQVLYGLG